MFKISVKDKNGKIIDLYSKRAQVEIDRFTTCFSDEKALLNKLGLDDNYRVIVTKNTGGEGIVEIPFTGSKYRNLIYKYNNSDYLKEVSLIKDRYYIKLYFLNELLRFEKDLSAYESNRFTTLKQIISYFETTEGLYFNDYTLFYRMKDYFKDNYSYFKDFYKYMTNFTKKEESIYENNTIKEAEDILKNMKEKLKDVKFEEKESELSYDTHELEFNHIIQSERDLDEKVEEIRMFVDEYKTNKIEDLSKKFINKL